MQRMSYIRSGPHQPANSSALFGRLRRSLGVWLPLAALFVLLWRPATAVGAERVGRLEARRRPVQVVVYTVKRGGSLRNVANLYRLHHYEIKKLNPGIRLDKHLGPGAKVVVYRRVQSRRSSSVGFPDRGSLVGAVPMFDGPGRSLRAIPWKRWATAHTVSTLDRILRSWHRVEPRYPLLIGNLSDRDGGRLSPHRSHRSGRDADLGYVQKRGVYKNYSWRVMNARNLDVARTWKFLRMLLASGEVEKIFMDRKIEALIYRYARRHPGQHRRSLSRWFASAKGRGRSVIQHARGHRDHMHVRFRCSPSDRRCRTR